MSLAQVPQVNYINTVKMSPNPFQSMISTGANLGLSTVGSLLVGGCFGQVRILAELKHINMRRKAKQP